MLNIVLDKKILFGIRVISIICVIFLTTIETIHQIKLPITQAIREHDFYSIKNAIGNSFVIILGILLSLYPHKLGFLATISFYYTFICTVFEINNPMGECMFFLGISVLYVRGEFLINRRKKIVFLTLFYIAITLTRLRFGINAFCNELIFQAGYLLVLSIPTFFFIAIIQKQKEQEKSSKILNLANFSGLVEKDVILLQKALENKQYKVIGYEVDRAAGTVRNRLNKVYDILGVVDKLGFISTYMGYEIVFQTEDLTSVNKTVNNLLYKKKKKKKKKKKF